MVRSANHQSRMAVAAIHTSCQPLPACIKPVQAYINTNNAGAAKAIVRFIASLGLNMGLTILWVPAISITAVPKRNGTQMGILTGKNGRKGKGPLAGYPSVLVITCTKSPVVPPIAPAIKLISRKRKVSLPLAVVRYEVEVSIIL